MRGSPPCSVLLHLRLWSRPSRTSLFADFRPGSCQGSCQPANSIAPQKPTNQRRYVLGCNLGWNACRARVRRDQQSQRVRYAKHGRFPRPPLAGFEDGSRGSTTRCCVPSPDAGRPCGSSLFRQRSRFDTATWNLRVCLLHVSTFRRARFGQSANGPTLPAGSSFFSTMKCAAPRRLRPRTV